MKKTILLFSLAAIASFTHGQVISTIAGMGGTGGFSGDAGPATAAELSYAGSAAVDAAGNMYIADISNNRIRMVNTSGTISTYAGNGVANSYGDGGQATAAAINTPYDVVMDGSGNLYIADYYNNCIRKVTSAGVISKFAGNGTYGYSGDGGPATAAEFSRTLAVCLDGSGNLYVSDYAQAIRKITPAGTITTYAGNGSGGFSGDGGQATAAKINTPEGICTDAAGNLYIADQANSRIRKVSTSGVITTVAGTGTAGFSGDGGQATAAELNLPFGVYVDASNNMYIADTYNNRIRKVTSAGVISTIAGNGTAGFSGDGSAATAAELKTPYRVRMVNSGNLLIADYGNKCIRMVTAPTAVNEVQYNNSISIYPNPNKGAFTLQLSVGSGQWTGKAQIEIYNMLGEEVYLSQLSIGNRSLSINLSAQPNGIYLVKVKTADGNSMVSKVEIER